MSSLLGNILFFFSLPFSASSFFDNEMIFPFRPSQPSRGDASEIKPGFGFSSALLWGAIFGAFGLAPLPLTTTKNPGLFSFFVPVRMDPSPSSGWEGTLSPPETAVRTEVMEPHGEETSRVGKDVHHGSFQRVVWCCTGAEEEVP